MNMQPKSVLNWSKNLGKLLMLSAFFFLISSAQTSAQISYKKKNPRVSDKYYEAEFKKNIVWLEGFGSNQIVGAKYERIFMFGPIFSIRVDAGITPFVMDYEYNFIVGRSITPITGLGMYFHFQPFPLRLGVGCSVLHDIYFDRIPETIIDSSKGYVTDYGRLTYRARVMPYVAVEYTIQDRWTIRAGYSPIIDPANHNQTDTYFTHFGMFGVGYKFGH